ncbi:MAG: leucine--tRNA ligase [Patescibacteria group bacterium]
MSEQKNSYDPREIEQRWQAQWAGSDLYAAKDSGADKEYVLVEFPYPSGEGLHVGHCLSYIAQDIVARVKRMQGKNVLYPIGWDAFGLPAENFAIKNKVKPQDATRRNIANFKRQIQSLGISFDWSREVNTTDPAYYRWTQWIFLQLFKKGLAEKKEVPINWCPKDKIGLAFEEVIDGTCERCGTATERRVIQQWVLKITEYADRLIDDLETVDFLPEIKQQQINWIGRSEGAEIEFRIKNEESDIKECLVIHGVSGNKRENWFPWIKTTLAKEGWKVNVPTLPAPDHPKINEWNEVAAKEFKADSVLIGHSLGAPAALNLIQTAGKKIDTLILVAPVNSMLDWKYLGSTYPSVDWEAVRSFADIKFDWKKITDLTKQIVVYYSDNDKYISESSIDFYKKYLPHATFKFLPGKGHFNSSSGVTEFSEVLEDIIPKIRIFTTRPDTLFGATYLVLSPEHEFIANHQSSITNRAEVQKYIEEAKRKTDRERLESKEKTGVELKGVKAINPATNKEIPIWVADYVLSTYGTGAIMAVPAHDERDFEFAKKYKLSIKPVVALVDQEIYTSPSFKAEKNQELIKRTITEGLAMAPTMGEGVLINSGKFDSMSSEKARAAITKAVDGAMTVQYKLRDWIFSRQHYWGEPIPIIHCEKCGYVPVPEKDLPVALPDVDHYEPTDTGESPLAKMTEWVDVSCPHCGGHAQRETDTMPNWAGSSWYFLRYTDPHNDKALADKKKLKYWLPVDLYNGGAEHTTLHLLYSRFWHKFLYDIKAVPTPEPYQRRVQHGMILGPDGQKMSKSRGNVINPDAIVEKYGADTFRLYMMFMGEYDQVKIWSDENLQGVWRFMKRFWDFMSQVSISEKSGLEELSLVHQTIKRVSNDMERRSFNTIVSHFMICLNGLQNTSSIGKEAAEDLIRLFAPFAPHFAEEIWHTILGHTESVHREHMPKVIERHIQTAGTTVGVQVDGKVRDELTITGSMTEKEVREAVLALPAVVKHMDGKAIKKFLYVKGKIVSIVTE